MDDVIGQDQLGEGLSKDCVGFLVVDQDLLEESLVEGSALFVIGERVQPRGVPKEIQGSVKIGDRSAQLVFDAFEARSDPTLLSANLVDLLPNALPRQGPVSRQIDEVSFLGAKCGQFGLKLLPKQLRRGNCMFRGLEHASTDDVSERGREADPAVKVLNGPL